MRNTVKVIGGLAALAALGATVPLSPGAAAVEDDTWPCINEDHEIHGPGHADGSPFSMYQVQAPDGQHVDWGQMTCTDSHVEVIE